MTKKINILANFGGFGGYQIVTYNLIKGLRLALLKEGKAFEDLFNLVPVQTANDPTSELNRKDLTDFMSGKYEFGPVSFGILPIDKFHTFGGEYRIGYPAIENQELTNQQKTFLSIVDEVVATSDFHRSLYKKAEFNCRKTMFGSYDPSIYFPLNKNENSEKILNNKKVNFLMVGKFERRKASMETIVAFCEYFENFPKIDNVTLHAKLLSDVHSRNIQQIKQELQTVFIKYPRASSRIFLVEDKNVDLLGLYQRADFLLFPSRGEGIGLPLIEAMACGVIPIVTPYTSFSDYTSSDYSIILPDEGTEPFLDPFYGLTETNAGMLGRVTIESIKNGIDQAMKLEPVQRLEMSNKAIEAIQPFSIYNQGPKNLKYFKPLFKNM